MSNEAQATEELKTGLIWTDPVSKAVIRLISNSRLHVYAPLMDLFLFILLLELQLPYPQ